MHSPDEFKKFTEDYAEFDQTDLLRMLLLTRKMCTTLRKMLYSVYDSDFSYTKAEVDAMIQEQLNGTSKYPGVPNEPSS